MHAYTVVEDTPLNVGDAAGLLANDSDPDGNPLPLLLKHVEGAVPPLSSRGAGRLVDPEIEALQEKIAAKLGYQLKGHKLELYGVPIKK